MKLKNYSFQILLLSTTLIFSCVERPPITFHDPQPIEEENLSEFPNQLVGEYLSEDGNSRLFIDQKMIQREYDIDLKMHISELDSNYSISGDTVIDIKENKKWPIIRIGDSLQIKENGRDTLFQINEKSILRMHKNNYYLNNYWDDEGWGIRKVKLTKGVLMLSNIREEEVEALRKVGKETLDSIPYKFKLENKNFLEFVKNGGFQNQEFFIKQKNSNN